MDLACRRCGIEIEESGGVSTTSCPFCKTEIVHSAPDSVAMPDLRRVFDRYDLIERVGSGATAHVWRAFDSKFLRDVAIKVPRRVSPNDQDARRFLKEARAVAKLRHPGIVEVYDVQDSGIAHIVSEFVSGGTLHAYLKQRTPPVAQIVSFAIQIVRAIRCAHESGIIHRDLKPSNILITQSQQLKICDFGLAKCDSDLLERSTNSDQTIEGDIKGTLPYMSPEQERGDVSQVDHRSDIYAFGVILYEMLTRQRPFDVHDGDFHRKVQSVTPVSPKVLNPLIVDSILERVCMRCLAKRPEDRYQAASEIEQELVAWQKGHSDDKQEPTRDVHPPRPVENEEAAGEGPNTDLPEDRVGDGQQSITHEPFHKLTRRQFLGFGAIAAASVGTLLYVNRPKKGNVRIVTDPPGAQIVAWGFHPQYGILDKTQFYPADDVSPVVMDLPPGDYFVVAALDDGRFHEVMRRVPKDSRAIPQGIRHWNYTPGEVAELTTIALPPEDVTEGMASVEGVKRFQIGFGNDEYHFNHRKIPGFHIDATEVTYGQLKRVFPDPPLGGIRSMIGREPPGDHIAVDQFWWDDALWMAEMLGKRLMFESEYEVAATNVGKSRFPWGDDKEIIEPWSINEVRTPVYDGVKLGGIEVHGLFSNAAEWTMSPANFYPRLDHTERGIEPPVDFFVVRGGSHKIFAEGAEIEKIELSKKQLVSIGSRHREFLHRQTEQLPKGVGFRCARSQRPKLSIDSIEDLLE